MAANEKDDITFEIMEHIGVISRYPTGWAKELNMVRWNGGSVRADLRDWDEDHEHMSRGVTLHQEEAKKLYELLGSMEINKTAAQQTQSASHKQARNRDAR